MYRKDDGQITLAEFNSPFGRLDPNNRWVRIADMVPWLEYEEKYAERFCDNNGAPAIRFRMALGTLIIKQRTGHSDAEVLQDIIENPYMQYLTGLHELTTVPPFSSVSITNFRKHITEDMVNEINGRLFREGRRDDGNGGGGGSDGGPCGAEGSPNKGTVMLDATCAPANIAYPTDAGLLNEAREKLEEMIDGLHPHTGERRKPRTYREKARKDYLGFAKQRKPQAKTIRKAVGRQLGYVARDIGHVDRQLQKAGMDKLGGNQREWLKAIRELHRQQRGMHKNKVHSTGQRIVSIGQPHVRPIVRGKANAAVEFGAKVSVSLIEGYAFIDKLEWEAYNEESQLIPAVESYRHHYGFYPEAVLADRIYRNRENRRYCKERNIRLRKNSVKTPIKMI